MIAALDSLRQLHLLCRRQQIYLADVLQEQLQRVEKSIGVRAFDAHKILLAETRALPAKADIEEAWRSGARCVDAGGAVHHSRDCAGWFDSVALPYV
jgi:hypothetical protein